MIVPDPTPESPIGQSYRYVGSYPSPRLFTCALHGWKNACTEASAENRQRNWMVWDHCHTHDIIRGPLCGYHNWRLGRNWPRDQDDPEIIAYQANCPACIGQPATELPRRGQTMRMGGPMMLSSAEAAWLYREERRSACEIAQMYSLTRIGAERKIRQGGVQGVQWCRIHRTLEESFSGSVLP